MDPANRVRVALARVGAGSDSVGFVLVAVALVAACGSGSTSQQDSCNSGPSPSGATCPTEPGCNSVNGDTSLPVNATCLSGTMPGRADSPVIAELTWRSGFLKASWPAGDSIGDPPSPDSGAAAAGDSSELLLSPVVPRGERQIAGCM
jgi:hypothetical protein